MAVVAAEASPIAGRSGGSHGDARCTPRFRTWQQPHATDRVTPTQISRPSGHSYCSGRSATFLAFLRAAKKSKEQAARTAQSAFYRGLQELAKKPHYALPDSGVLTQGYGGAGGHPGIDIAGPYGSPVLAAANGVVAFAGQQSGYGNFIEIRQPDGAYTAYGHLSSIGVTVGQQVFAGQQIGQEGSTGESTGPHLHFELRLGLNGPTEDPLAWLNARGITVAGQGCSSLN